MSIKRIPFSTPMAQALLDGRKTQTRRVLNQLRGHRSISEFGVSDTPGYDWHFRDEDMRWHDHGHASLLKLLPYQVGDLLYVREAWKTFISLDHIAPRDLLKNGRGGAILFVADNGGLSLTADGERYSSGISDDPNAFGRYRQGMHMPRWASRLTLKVTDVRIQQLQEITQDDVLAEGAPIDPDYRDTTQDHSSPPMIKTGVARWQTPRAWYHELWDGLNEKRGFAWDVNPWVHATTFEVHHGNVDDIADEVAA